MPIEHTTLIRGPGFISFAGEAIHAAGDIAATVVEEWSDDVTAGYGRIGRRLKNRQVEVTAQPLMLAGLAALYPYGSAQPGDPLFGATDEPLVITPRNGRPLTVNNAAVTKLAPLRLSARPPLIAGRVTWTGLVSHAASGGNLADYFVQGDAGEGAALTGFSPAVAIGRRFTAARNSVALAADDGGYDIAFALALEKDQPDGEPVVGMRFKSLDATVKFIPIGLLESAYLALFNDAVAVGDSPAAHDIVISGAMIGDPKVTIANTHLQPGGWIDGNGPRNAPLAFESVRTINGTALTSLHTFGTVC